MKTVTPTEVHALKTAELGLNPDLVDLTSPETLACALRRAAGLLCPCSGASLVRAVLAPLDELVAESKDVTKERLEEIVEALVAHGDLLEQQDVGAERPEEAGVLLYTAPPSFVRRESGSVLLLGVVPDQPLPLPEELAQSVEHAGHVRRLHPLPSVDLPTELIKRGFTELSYQAWLRAPTPTSADECVAGFGRRLDESAWSRDVPGLRLLDPSSSVRYYRGRWTEPRTHTGRFVGRRSQAYGADLWSYVEVRDGQPQRLVDLPTRGSRIRGCDEAWRLQMAIDATRGHPQQCRMRRERNGWAFMDFFSPLPMWVRRRLDAVGNFAEKPGCLFTYSLGDAEVDEEIQFLRQDIWIEVMAD